MTTKIRIYLNLILLFSLSPVYAVELNYYQGWLFNDYYVDGKKLSPMGFNRFEPIENALIRHPQALAQFKKGAFTRSVGDLAIGLGIASILLETTWTLVQDDHMQQLFDQGKFPSAQINKNVLAAGVTGLAIGLPLRVLSHRQIAKSIDLFNKKSLSNAHLYFKFNRVGLGFYY